MFVAGSSLLQAARLMVQAASGAYSAALFELESHEVGTPFVRPEILGLEELRLRDRALAHFVPAHAALKLLESVSGKNSEITLLRARILVEQKKFAAVRCKKRNPQARLPKHLR